ncbi:MAG: SDR family NAD(P)-dependent oxidoreductase [Chloroflexi bacterium]|nr:MAG: SDR family NAD(P)-dependent oxidoreductase [Chloroflexota bacterium]
MANSYRPVAVVTGASSGIGAATVVALGRLGYRIAAGARRLDRVRRVVGESGLASGLNPIDQARDDEWVEMWEVNVLGLMRMTRACLPLIRKARHGHIVNLGSIAGFETYKGGAGYTASKHAVHAISRTLRLELNGEPIRVTEIEPGMVETEFSLVRFHGDRKAAKDVYKGVKPLVAADIADCIVFAVTRPPHVDIDEIIVRPIAQAAAWLVARKG